MDSRTLYELMKNPGMSTKFPDFKVRDGFMTLRPGDERFSRTPLGRRKQGPVMTIQDFNHFTNRTYSVHPQ